MYKGAGVKGDVGTNIEGKKSKGETPNYDQTGSELKRPNFQVIDD